MKLNKPRHILACFSLVLFLGFGWFDSLWSGWDYLYLGNTPVITQSAEGPQTAPEQDTTDPPADQQSTAATAGSAAPQCPGCPKTRPRPGRPPGT